MADAAEGARDERDRAADQREQTADEREQAADQREQAADQRESLADGREQGLADWEQRLDRRDRQLGMPVPTSQERGREAIGRARAALEASMARLDRSEAALSRTEQAHDREQQQVDREAAESLREWASHDDDGGSALALAAAAEQLRTELVTAARKLSEVQDLIAARGDRLATQEPENEQEHRRLAESARTTAQRARDTVHRFSC
ncbi:hypothetical protein [Amycolatopsis anabasis]|uniref:hypothetical protein n=1 Tax=Amycolatopsis anabasis TaxID=1840409 RepID=UPI00131D2C68|nr:hypothetical protein [Amycolatopsis anabasis]